MRILAPGILVLAVFSTGCVVAAQPSKEKSEQHAMHDSRHAVAFTEAQRNAVHGYYVDQRGKGHCPPGLAKKGNGCMPPGQAKKRYTVGQPLPTGVVMQRLPADLARLLGTPAVGYSYGYLDGDLVKLAADTMLVVDAIAALTN